MAHRTTAAGTCRSERGAALVEFALVVPLVMAIALGVLTGGFATYQKITLTGAARQGARIGSVLPQTQCTPTSRCSNLNWAQYVQAQAVADSAGSLSSSDICVALVSGSGSAPVAVDSTTTTAGGTSPCFVDNSADTGKRVQVQVTKAAKFEVIFFSRTITLTSKAISRFEQ
ncbi:MAG: TadE/TadG family type IV pilus assembly protein [Actinomycetes bacterium]